MPANTYHRLQHRQATASVSRVKVVSLDVLLALLCNDAVPGKYQPNPNQGVCLTCPFGASPSEDKTSCQLTASNCQAGNYVSTSNVCTPCSTGTISAPVALTNIVSLMGDRHVYLWRWPTAMSRSPRLPCWRTPNPSTNVNIRSPMPNLPCRRVFHSYQRSDVCGLRK
jgi:hypothetical protein